MSDGSDGDSADGAVELGEKLLDSYARSGAPRTFRRVGNGSDILFSNDARLLATTLSIHALPADVRDRDGAIFSSVMSGGTRAAPR